MTYVRYNIFFSLLAASENQACGGRKRKFLRLQDFNMGESMPDNKNFETDSDDFGLDSSIDDSITDLDDENSRDAKKLFTIWTTSFSTKTATVYELNRSITLSVSAACTLAFNPVPGCA